MVKKVWRYIGFSDDKFEICLRWKVEEEYVFKEMIYCINILL